MSLIGQYGGRLGRAARNVVAYNVHLKNGVQVLGHRLAQTEAPPLVFRNGLVWHHGPLDQPYLMLDEIFLQKLYEPLDAPPGANVLDIGANMGALTTYWALGRPDITIHAYEPNPDSHATLLRNIEANGIAGQVRPFQEAIGRTGGTLELWTGVPTALATAYGDALTPEARKVPVPMIALDEAWERLGRRPIFMLKIDTEGGEIDILEGASDAMLAAVQTACIEWHDNIVPGAYERCRRRLDAAGFAYHVHRHPWNEGIFYARKQARASRAA